MRFALVLSNPPGRSLRWTFSQVSPPVPHLDRRETTQDPSKKSRDPHSVQQTVIGKQEQSGEAQDLARTKGTPRGQSGLAAGARPVP